VSASAPQSTIDADNATIANDTATVSKDQAAADAAAAAAVAADQAAIDTCPCRKSNPNVLMMQSAEMRLGENLSDALNCA
jgi:hypothetical protein